MFSTRAQGTIEYLVIVAVVVVISLAIVGLATNIFTPSAIQAGNTSGQISNKAGVGGISITEAVADSNGNALITFRNVAAGNITLTKITPVNSNGTTGISNNYNTSILQGDTTTFSLSDINASCPCNPGDTTKTCEFQITIITDTGLQKVLTTDITTNCSTTVTPTNSATVVGLGSGTLADPWIINSCTELQNMQNHLDGNYALGADINCYETINWNSGAGFMPLGWNSGSFFDPFHYHDSFSGRLDGKNKTIIGLYIYRPGTMFIGLFSAFSSSNAGASNLGLVDVNITGSTYTGGLVGDQYNGSIINSYSTGNVTGFSESDGDCIGGLIGAQNNTAGSVSNSFSSASVTGYNFVGGLAGCTMGIITNSYATGNVTGTYNVGGLIGQFEGLVNASYSSSIVTGINYVGGLVGLQVSGAITNSYTLSDVNGNQNIGGLIGDFYRGTISNSYAISDVNGIQNIGGLIGYSEDTGKLKNCFSVGDVNGVQYVGGLIGKSLNTATGDVNMNYSISKVTRISGSANEVRGFIGLAGNTASIGYANWNPTLTTYSTCYRSGSTDYNTNCTAVTSTTSNFYGASGIPFANLGFDGNWVARDNNYPILSWQ